MSDQIHHPSEEADTNPTTGDTSDVGDFPVGVDDVTDDTDTDSGQDTGTE